MSRARGAMRDLCIDCDAMVLVSPHGWYRCASCGYESIRTDCGCQGGAPLNFNVDGRPAQPAAGLVSLSHKGEKK